MRAADGHEVDLLGPRIEVAPDPREVGARDDGRVGVGARLSAASGVWPATWSMGAPEVVPKAAQSDLRSSEEAGMPPSP
jgi:hypothetical protein